MAMTDGFYPGETVTVYTFDGRVSYLGTVVDIDPCDRIVVRDQMEGVEELHSIPARFVAHGNAYI